MNRLFASLLLLCATCLIAPRSAWAVTIDTVPVGNAGNGNDPATGDLYGGVAYDYRIGRTEVTNSQYVEFLNAKAASDPLALYDTRMGSGYGGIMRDGSDGSYTYATITGRGDKPVNYVSWYASIRFANWLNNGQGSRGTEAGAYTLGAVDADGVPTNGNSITRNAGATWFLTSENEWHKAAYHKNDGVTSNYFAYPTSSDAAATAEAPPGVSNSANYDFVVHDLTNVGAYTLSDSPYGTFDQGGNVWEWNEALINPSFRGLRGGSFDDNSGTLLSSFRNGSLPAAEGSFIGFRVATVPEPSSFALATFGLLALAASQSRRIARRAPPQFNSEDRLSAKSSDRNLIDL